MKMFSLSKKLCWKFCQNKKKTCLKKISTSLFLLEKIKLILNRRKEREHLYLSNGQSCPLYIRLPREFSPEFEKQAWGYDFHNLKRLRKKFLIPCRRRLVTNAEHLRA